MVNIEHEWDLHQKIISKSITSEDRKAKVLSMIESIGERYLTSPASSNRKTFRSYAGGYIEHVNSVVKTAYNLNDLITNSGKQLDYTMEELTFAALFYSLGKMGIGDKPYYLEQTDSWRKDKLGALWTINDELDYMRVSDRSLFILQSHGINLSEKEYLAIKLYSGLYDKSNEAYMYKGTKSYLPQLIHMADKMSADLSMI